MENGIHNFFANCSTVAEPTFILESPKERTSRPLGTTLKEKIQ